MKLITYIMISWFCVATATTGWCQRQLQDNFWLEKSWTNGFTLANSIFGIAVDFSNRCYVANGGAIYVYDDTGKVITNWAVASVVDVAFDPVSNRIFTCSATTNGQIRVYNSAFTQVNAWGTNSLSNPYGISIGTNGFVYIADYGNNRIQVFTGNGTWTNQWGKTGSAGGEFSFPLHLASGSDGSIYVADYSNTRLQRFDSMGGFLGQYGPISGWNPRRVAVSPDGIVCAFRTSDTAPRVITHDLSFLFNLSSGATSYLQALTFSPDGQRLYLLSQNDVRVFRRGYRTFGTIPPNAVPLPVIYGVAQRATNTWVDIDFAVVDPDNTNVTTAAISFMDGRQDLRSAILMTNYVEGTGTILSSNIVAGQRYRLTWNAGADWQTNFGNVKINILAKDNRNLVDFHFLTIPPTPLVNPFYTNTFTISRSPLQDADFLGVWTWLLARNDTNVVLQSGGEVRGTSGSYSNVVLAQTPLTNTLTTAEGRSFIFGLLNVREANTGEVYRAKIGTTGRVTQWTPRAQVGNLPLKVNEFGFDTGLFTTNLTQTVTNAWWVVPLTP